MTWIMLILILAGPLFAQEFVITAGGDVNFGHHVRHPHHRLLDHGGVKFHKGRRGEYTWREMTGGFAHLINGDLNFANLETVISPDRQGIHPGGGQFVFVSHPAGVQHFVDIGFNLFALSNNHAYDFGRNGVYRTLESMKEIKQGSSRNIHYAGLDTWPEVADPVVFRTNGFTVAFASITFNNAGSPTKAHPGQISIARPSQYNELLDNFAALEVDLRIISIHAGKEGTPIVRKWEKDNHRRAIDRGKVDIVIGHHPHTVQPVEIYKGKPIIYSLGNFVMLGASDLDRKPIARDYGAFARVAFQWQPNTQSFKLGAMDFHPIKGMHYAPYLLKPIEVQQRLAFLNKETDRQFSKTGALFQYSRQHNSGVYCAANRDANGGASFASEICDLLD